jgi:HK97 family phage prohead protease
MEIKTITGFVKAVGEEGRGWDIEVVCSTDAADRDGEIIDQAGWQLDAFRQNPVFLAEHQHRLDNGRSPVLGSFKQIAVVPSVGLVGRITFAETALGQEYKTLYKDGHMSAVSVGFTPLASEPLAAGKTRSGKRYTKMELLEVSACPVGANREALTVVRGVGGLPGDGVTRGQVEAAALEIKLTLVSAISGVAACVGDTKALADYETIAGEIRGKIGEVTREKGGLDLATQEDLRDAVADIGIFIMDAASPAIQSRNIIEGVEGNWIGKAVFSGRSMGDDLGDEVREETEREGRCGHGEPGEDDGGDAKDFETACKALAGLAGG